VEILPGIWQFTAPHPEWEEGEDWPREVNWWAARVPEGLLLVDPLVEDWAALDALVQAAGGCAGIVRTIHFHQRSIAEAAARYGADVSVPAGAVTHPTPREDEIVVWLPGPRALLFGDVMVRSADGELTICPESWVRRIGGYATVRAALAPLLELGAEHARVSHGPLVLGDAAQALPRALS
jgi:hypothetical protein